jgi:hypothetical protein
MSERFSGQSRIEEVLSLGHWGERALYRHGYDVGQGFKDRLSQRVTLEDAASSGRIRDMTRLLELINDIDFLSSSWAIPPAPAEAVIQLALEESQRQLRQQSDEWSNYDRNATALLSFNGVILALLLAVPLTPSQVVTDFSGALLLAVIAIPFVMSGLTAAMALLVQPLVAGPDVNELVVTFGDGRRADALKDLTSALWWGTITLNKFSLTKKLTRLNFSTRLLLVGVFVAFLALLALPWPQMASLRQAVDSWGLVVGRIKL